MYVFYTYHVDLWFSTGGVQVFSDCKKHHNYYAIHFFIFIYISLKPIPFVVDIIGQASNKTQKSSVT